MSSVSPARFLNVRKTVQLFADTGNGFSEAESIRVGSASRIDRLEFDLSSFKKEILRLRFDPCDFPWTFLKLRRLEIVVPGMSAERPKLRSNAVFRKGDFYLFASKDSQIHISGKRKPAGLLVAEVEFLSVIQNPMALCVSRLSGERADFMNQHSDRASILVVDHQVPEFDKNAGNRMTFHYLMLMRKIGLNVVFLSDSPALTRRYTRVLRKLGIHVVPGDKSDSLTSHLGSFEYFCVYRPHLFRKYAPWIYENKARVAKVIYFTQDMHHLRLERTYEVTGLEWAKTESQKVKEEEREACAKADVVYAVGPTEKKQVEELVPKAVVRAVPVLYFSPNERPQASFRERKDLLYFGSYNFDPNVDAFRYLIRDIMPAVFERLPGVRLLVAGSDPTKEIWRCAGPRIRVLGQVSDARLSRLLNQCRFLVTPLRYGAGVKGKNIQGMQSGIGVITSEIGAEGIQRAEAALWICRSRDEFIETIVKAYHDETAFSNKTKIAASVIRDHFNETAATELIRQDLSPEKKVTNQDVRSGLIEGRAGSDQKPRDLEAVRMTVDPGRPYSPIPDLNEASRENAAILKKPLVSVVIPSYQHARFVGAAVESVLAQTYPHFELILIDDGSTDGSAEILKGYRDSRIHFISQTNAGAHATLNRGMAAAKGDYLAFLNSDDLFPPTKLEVCVSKLEERKNLDVLCGGVNLIDEDGAPLPSSHKTASWYAGARSFYDRKQDLIPALFNGNFVMTTSNIFLRRKAAARIGEFRPLKYAHDLDYLVRAADSVSVAIDRETGVLYRWHAHNTIQVHPAWVRWEVALILADHLFRHECRDLERGGREPAFARLVEAARENGLEKGAARFMRFFYESTPKEQPARFVEILRDPNHPMRRPLIEQMERGAL